MCLLASHRWAGLAWCVVRAYPVSNSRLFGVLIFFLSYLTVALGFGLRLDKTRA